MAEKLRHPTIPRLGPAAALTAAVCALVALAPASASAASREHLRDSFLLSSSATGGLPNGPSRNPSISMDARYSRVIAYDSEASNIVGGDSNGVRDVFAVKRRAPFSNQGEGWVPGETFLVSDGLGGRPANGPSYNPDVSGDPGIAPRCIAFVSEASNLVRGDTNRRADVFVHHLGSGKIERVSVSTRGGQANGSSYEVAVDGDCTRIVFSSSANNLALTSLRGYSADRQRALRTLRTGKPRRGTRQVYMHVLRASGIERFLKGATFLISADGRGRPGRGSSYEPDIDIKRGERVVFTSEAALAAGDGNGQPDVYMSELNEYVSGKGSKATTLRSFKPRTRLVSARADGRAGNGASSSPSADGFGRHIAYQTTATDLLPGDTNGVPDIVRATVGSGAPARLWASRTTLDGEKIGNGGSYAPVISTGGTNAIFLSDATNFETSGRLFRHGDVNGVRDLFIWTANRHRTFLQSKSSDEGPLGLPVTNLALSARTNYILMETASPFTDLNVVRSHHPDWLRDPLGVQAHAAQDPAFNQIYLRYLGPE